MDFLFLLSAHESVRFLFVCRERPACRSHPGRAEKGNGTKAGPYKMSRDTRPRVSATLGSAARTPREGYPYDVNVGMHHLAGMRKASGCVLWNGR